MFDFVTRRRDERGSLVVMLTIIFVLTLLLAATFSEVVANQSNVLAKYHSASAIAGADAGISDALFRLDQLSSPASGTAFCMDANGTGYEGSSQCSAASGPLTGVSYVATPSSGGTVWTIEATATANGVSAAAEETATYTTGFPYALFGNSGLDFSGNNTQGVGAYNEGTSSGSNPDTNAADCTSNVGSSCVSIGSNGPIKCSGGLGSNVDVVYYTGGGSPQGCGSNQTPNTSKYPITTPTAPSGVSPNCPGTAVTSGGVTTYELGSGYGVSTVGTSGTTTTYYCSNDALAISGTLTVKGTVKIYVILDSATDTSFVNSSTYTLAIAGGSEVNTTFDGTSGTPSGATLPTASALQIYSNTDGTVGSANGGSAYTYAGIIDAPNGNLVGEGCKSAYYGSVTLSTLTCHGGPHLKVYYDNALKNYYGSPTLSGYAQTNPSSVTVP